MRNFFFLLFLLLVLVAAVGSGLYIYKNKSASVPPQFSSYEEVDAQLSETAAKQAFLPELIDYIFTNSRTTYPSNDLKNEIKRLVALKEQRTESVIAQHTKEYDDIMNISVEGGQTLRDFIGIEARPLTNEIYRVFTHDIAILVAQKKMQYNIARPEQMDVAINTSVETPATPSYPSLFAAQAAVAGEILSHFMKPEEYQKIAKALDEALLRKQIVGVSTQFDTDYAKQLAVWYSTQVLEHERAQEFLAMVEEKEWTNDVPWKPSNSGKVLPNLTAANVVVVPDSKSLLFSSVLENTGEAATPGAVSITMEIDRYNDGTVDRVVVFSLGSVMPGERKEAKYLLSLDWPGTHSVRFVVNKSLDFLETYHHDNYTGWTEFTVKE